MYQFDLARDSRRPVLNCWSQHGTCVVKDGTHADPHVTLSMAGEDCIKVLNGQYGGWRWRCRGDCKITGDIGLAMQLKSLFPNAVER